MDDTQPQFAASLGAAVTHRGRQRPASIGPSDWRLIVVFWLVIGVLMAAYAVAKPAGIPLFGDNAMRMVSALDLLHGQDWQDLTQYRDNVPYGASMHWSRLIDAPLALLVTLATPLVGASSAVEIATLIWPLLLVLPMLVLCVVVSRRLVPDSDTITALALPVVSIVLIVEFMPGRVDHHNVQMLLALVAATVLLTARIGTGGAIIAALASATSLAIGMETLPFVAVTIAAYGLLWLFDPRGMARPLAVFGISIAAGTLAHFVLATPPAAYLTPACDMLSIAYVTPMLIGGCGLAAVAWAGSRGDALWQRLLLLALAGSVTFGTFAILYPDCLAGPYAMAELLAIPGYFEEILEAQSLLTAFTENWANAALYVAAIVVALGVTAWRALAERGEQRVDWLILLAFLAAASAVLWLQLRGVRFAALFALPAGVWLITRARSAYLARSNLRRLSLLVGSWVLVSGAAHYGVIAAIAWMVPGGAAYTMIMAAEIEAKQRCVERPSYAALATLPQGRVLANFNLGSNLLLFTPHSVVSAGFHRNVAGTTDVVDFLSGDEEKARRIATSRAIDYLVICPITEEYSGTVGPDADSHWSWLTPLSDPSEPLQIYRVNL